jgi:hypothetical protein
MSAIVSSIDSTSAVRTVPSVAGAPARTRLRITRRGRRVVASAVALGVAGIVGGVLLAGPGAQASDSSAAATFEHVTVEGGETLWQVAHEIAPTKDPRDVVSDIVRLNALGSAEVSAGQSLAVPTKYTD